MSHQSIDFKVIDTPLQVVITNVLSDLERWPAGEFPKGFTFTLRTLLLLANHTYRAIRVLVVKDFRYAGEAKVLCRSLLDEVFTVYLLLADPEMFVPKYWKTGWREKFEFLARNKKGLPSDDSWVQEYEEFLRSAAETAGLTPEEQDEPEGVGYWPTPPQMLGKRHNYRSAFSDSVVQFLVRLAADYYHPLSHLVHVSERGLALRAGPLLGEVSETKQGLWQSEPVHISMMLLLTMLSEITITFRLPYETKLAEIWTYLAETVPIHKELYNIRCRPELERQRALRDSTGSGFL